MITLITGAPGAGKTNALVSLLAELAEGRALYVSGIPDLQVPHPRMFERAFVLAPLEDLAPDVVPVDWRRSVPTDGVRRLGTL